MDSGASLKQDFRFALKEDVPALVRLINEAFAVEKFFKVDDRTHAEEVLKYMKRGRFLVAEDANGINGTVYVEAGQGRGYIGMLSVAPFHQKQGLGTRLMSAAEEFCREAGCEFVDISVVNLREELPAIYAGMGYVETGSEPFPVEEKPVKIPCYFIRMSKELGHR